MPQSVKRREVYALAKDLGLTRGERLDLAEMLLKKDCGSWDSLNESDIARLGDAMLGVVYCAELLRQRV